MEIDIIRETEVPISDDCIKQFLCDLLRKEGLGDNVELSILFTNNEKIKTLNREYRGIDKATNVLSFSMREGISVPFDNILGDIVISEEYARNEAKEMGITEEERIIQLLIHGVLHLIGYDHEKEAEYEKMKKKEDFYFNQWKEKN